MKHSSIIIFIFSFCVLYGQEDLKNIDTTFDFNERFYQNGKLTITNTKLYTDSINIYSIDQLQINQKMDTTQLECIKHVLWIAYYNKKWKPSDNSNYT